MSNETKKIEKKVTILLLKDIKAEIRHLDALMRVQNRLQDKFEKKLAKLTKKLNKLEEEK